MLERNKAESEDEVSGLDAVVVVVVVVAVYLINLYICIYICRARDIVAYR